MGEKRNLVGLLDLIDKLVADAKLASARYLTCWAERRLSDPLEAHAARLKLNGLKKIGIGLSERPSGKSPVAIKESLGERIDLTALADCNRQDRLALETRT
jgi:hypothetical protein